MGNTAAYNYNPYLVKRNTTIATLIFIISAILIAFYSKVTYTNDMTAVTKVSFIAVLFLNMSTSTFLYVDAMRISHYIKNNKLALIISANGFTSHMRTKEHHILWRNVNKIKFLNGPEGPSLIIKTINRKQYVLSFSRIDAFPHEVISIIEKNSIHRVSGLPKKDYAALNA